MSGSSRCSAFAPLGHPALRQEQASLRELPTPTPKERKINQLQLILPRKGEV